MHLLVVANETVTGRSLIEAVERHRDGDLRVTVICPVNQPDRGYVVYEDTRRAAAGRRLDRTLSLLREAAIPAHGLVVENDPVSAVRVFLRGELRPWATTNRGERDAPHQGRKGRARSEVRQARD